MRWIGGARRGLAAGGCALATACASSARGPTPPPAGVEAVSLLGDTLRAPALAPATRAAYEQRLADAERDLAARPGDADALIWVGRRTAYLGRYREAIAIFTRGAAAHPGDARMLRHRGHRLITVRDFAGAVRDLEHAARLIRGRPDDVEPDGLPNARGIPTGTLHSNIWYHLALAHYLRGDFARALAANDACLRVSGNPDMLVATTYWRWLILRRLGREAEAAAALAPITRELDIIENGSYHRLLLLFKGELPPDSAAPAGAAALDDATTGYGVGGWHLVHGRRGDAVARFERVRTGGQWAAFGYIAAEAELARLRQER